jgi:hypothetical protein
MGIDAIDTHSASIGDTPHRPDLELAAQAVRLHCVSRWPTGRRCLNCGWAHPCGTYERARAVLRLAGWSDREIAALDTRQGAWS